MLHLTNYCLIMLYRHYFSGDRCSSLIQAKRAASSILLAVRAVRILLGSNSHRFARCP